MGSLFTGNKDTISLSTKIFNFLRDSILDGKYKQGDKLVEIKLAKELGVSRTPVREGLKQLELEGLVENIPNKGVIVKGISEQDISDILTIRLAIEGIAAQWAVERMTNEDFKELKEIYELMEFYTYYKKDVEKILELNTEFHELIYKASKSRYLEYILKGFQRYMKGVRKKSLNTEGRLEEALNEHKEILKAFEERNPKKAKEVLEKHITKLKENALNENK
ncbi:GntR family transcriptional regulator [Thermohalobacter berrensis]|uniref:GntR family transcriptional regulator n=1 Tax=Thermohalobacter berrensis TaxID=99594 RepID=A0A419T9K6_9FIRM|nr:GntR family transcriptional regulator [Thermohalobacter berrensis]RKD34160.1 GntR family transcriptional regulator [Thermohalobacter berrensis]